MDNKWISRLEDVMLQLGYVHNAMAKTSLSSNEYNPISGNFAKAKVELFNLYNEAKSKESELPNLPKSTENLSKIADKDEWLNEVRGNDETFVDIAAPIGDFIFNQTDIVGTPGNDGMYYHYADVCKMLRRYSDSKLSELEKWIDEELARVGGTLNLDWADASLYKIKDKINFLKQQS